MAIENKFPGALLVFKDISLAILYKIKNKTLETKENLSL